MQKIKGFLGLAWKSGNLVYGHYLFKALSKNQVYYVFISQDMGPSQKQKLVQKCLFYQVPFDQQTFTKTQFCHLFGGKSVVAVGLTEQKLANQIINLST